MCQGSFALSGFRNMISFRSFGPCSCYQKKCELEEGSWKVFGFTFLLTAPWRIVTHQLVGLRWSWGCPDDLLFCFSNCLCSPVCFSPCLLPLLHFSCSVWDRWQELCGGISSLRVLSTWTRYFSSWGKNSTRLLSCMSTTTAPCSHSGGSASNGWQEDSVSSSCHNRVLYYAICLF